MKKLFPLAVFLFLTTSCQEKLPSNIEEKVKQLKNNVKYLDEAANPIFFLNQEKIDQLSSDSMSSLWMKYEIREGFYTDTKKELDELLKYNAKFSDYEEVKSIKEPNYYKDMNLFYTNLRYLKSMQLFTWNKEKGYTEYNEKPTYDLNQPTQKSQR